MYYYNLQVTVIGKIMNITPEEETTTRSGIKMKFASVKLSDISGTIKLVVWGQHINEITLGNSYKVENVGIKEFNVKYLSTNPSTLITKEADIGPVKEEDTETELMDYTGDVQLVLCEIKYMCIGCHNKIEGTSDSAKVRCGKCRMAQKKTQLKKSASLKIKLDSSDFRFYISTKLTSQFFQEQDKAHLMDDEEDIEDFLLDSRLKLAVTKDNPTSVISIQQQ